MLIKKSDQNLFFIKVDCIMIKINSLQTQFYLVCFPWFNLFNVTQTYQNNLTCNLKVTFILKISLEVNEAVFNSFYFPYLGFKLFLKSE